MQSETNTTKSEKLNKRCFTVLQALAFVWFLLLLQLINNLIFNGNKI